jgi:hypothetical protein
VEREARIHGHQLLFTAPGDDWYDGRVDHYTLRAVRANGIVVNSIVKPTGDAATREAINLPPGTKTVEVQAVDEADNLGGRVTVRR